MMHFRPAKKNSSAFTILEIMVAVTIFAIVSIAIFSVFNAAIRSQRIGQRESTMLERTRYALDSMGRDVNNIYFRDETSYNVSISRMIDQLEQARLEAEENNDWDSFYTNYGHPEGSGKDDDEKPTIGNPYEKGRIIDLQFVGKDQGETDSISFAIRQPLRVGSDYLPFGLSRVQYTLEAGVLIRSEDTVETAPRTIDGDVIIPPDPPRHSILAEGISGFELSYAFWYDNQWYETTSWNSANRQIRNPRYYLEEHDREDDRGDDRRENDNSLLPGDPGWNEYLNDLDSEPLDRLPAYIRIKLFVSDVDNPERVQEFTRLVRVPGAVETFSIREEIEEEDREIERAARDDKYVPIYPAVTEEY